MTAYGSTATGRPQPSPAMLRVRASLIGAGWDVVCEQHPDGLTLRSPRDGVTVKVHVWPVIDNADDGPRDGL